MDPLPSFGDLLSSLSLSEQSEQDSIPTRPRSESQSSTSSSSSVDMLDEHLDSPPPDIASIAESSSRSMRLAKSRSVGRLRGSRYAPYQDCSRRPSLPCLPNIALCPPSPAGAMTHEARPSRVKHSRSRSNNTDSVTSSPISLYARRGHSRQNSLNSTSLLSVQAPQSPLFDPPKLPTIPIIQPLNLQNVPQRSPRMPLAPLDSPSYPRQVGLRISGYITPPDSAPARFVCA